MCPAQRAMEGSSEHTGESAIVLRARAAVRLAALWASRAVLLSRTGGAAGNCVLVSEYGVVRELCTGQADRRLTTATGGRVELARFSWRPLSLAVEVDGLTIHGLEAPGEVPYAHVDRVAAQAKIIDLFKAQVGLRSLEVDHPVFHLIVYPDGSTNQPVPKKKTESNKPITDTIFDLQANRAVVNNGLLLLNQRALPFNVAGKNLSTLITYRPQPESYLGTVHVEDLTAERGKAPALHSKLDLNWEMARNAMKLDGLHFASGESKLDASGVLNDFTKLNWQLGANGTVDLRAVAAVAAVQGLERGETHCKFRDRAWGLRPLMCLEMFA